MTITEFGHNVLSFLSETWRMWLIYAILSLVGYFFYWYLFQQRLYKAIEGKAFVRHGRLGKWVDLTKHLHDEHNIDT
jgi:hypothetical protein